MEFQQFIDLAKHHKMAWVESTDLGDMPPTVIGIRDKEPVLLVIAPEIDKYQGLNAIHVLRRGMGIDSLVFITDAHTILTKGKSEAEIKRLQEKYMNKPGSMQRACDEEGACELGELADCLCIHYFAPDKKYNTVSCPYFYHGKNGGAEFRWLEEYNMEMLDCPVVPMEEIEKHKESKEAGNFISGFIPNSILHLMEQPHPLDVPVIATLMKTASNEQRQQEAEIRARTMMSMEIATRKWLESQNYITMEFVSYNGSYEDFLKKMAEKYTAAFEASNLIPDPQAVLEILKQMEAEANGNEEILAEIRSVRERVQEELSQT